MNEASDITTFGSEECNNDKTLSPQETEKLFYSAIRLIVNQNEDGDFICEELHKYKDEGEKCSECCKELKEDCVLRLLNHKAGLR